MKFVAAQPVGPVSLTPVLLVELLTANYCSTQYISMHSSSSSWMQLAETF